MLTGENFKFAVKI